MNKPINIYIRKTKPKLPKWVIFIWGFFTAQLGLVIAILLIQNTVGLPIWTSLRQYVQLPPMWKMEESSLGRYRVIDPNGRINQYCFAIKQYAIFYAWENHMDGHLLFTNETWSVLSDQ